MKRCYIYTRVSTAAQIDGYSLEAQEECLRKYADFQNLKIMGTYCDAGKSGGSIKGRPEFQNMLDDICSQKDDISYVLVFKLSRFGRNAADILKSLQLLTDYGIDLVCVEDSIDSSTQGGRLTLSILSAVAEIEKENIAAQFYAGKMQKFSDGGYPGGALPYGYRSVDKEPVIDPSEADIIRKIYELYLQEGMGAITVAAYLNENGFTRNVSNPDLPENFTYDFVARALDNPFYCGRMLYNRRTNKKDANGHIIVKDPSEVIEIKGKYEPIVSEKQWNLVHEKRERHRRKYSRKENPEHMHLLTGLVRCPFCGKGLVGSRDQHANPNHGGYYKTIYYYNCRYSSKAQGCICGNKRRYNQDKIDSAVYEYMKNLPSLPILRESITRALNADASSGDSEEQLRKLRKELRSRELAGRKLGDVLDSLDVLEPEYDAKYDETQKHMDDIYDEIDLLELKISKVRRKLERQRSGIHSAEKIETLLQNFSSIYDQMRPKERREFFRTFIERIDLYPDKRDDGRLVKSISFNIPLEYDDVKTERQQDSDGAVCFTLDCSKLDKASSESKATYAGIKAYIKETEDVTVSSLNIAQTKRKYGLDIGKAYNKPEGGNKHRVPNCPRAKEELILKALKHFRMIDYSVELIEDKERVK